MSESTNEKKQKNLATTEPKKVEKKTNVEETTSSWKIFSWLNRRNNEGQPADKDQNAQKSEDDLHAKGNHNAKVSEKFSSEPENLDEENIKIEKQTTSLDKKIRKEEHNESEKRAENFEKFVAQNPNDIENLENFYKYLETKIELLDDSALTNKQRAGLEKIAGYLKKTKSRRSFEQRVLEVRRIIRAYNSLVALNPKTKDGAQLQSIPLGKIKSFQEVIYLEIFDNLTARLENLKSDKKFDGLDIRDEFDQVLSLNLENKEKFQNSTSGKDKRIIMTNSAESYDALMEKIWKYPEFVRTKKDREQFDRIGYTLDPVILSIDINSK